MKNLIYFLLLIAVAVTAYVLLDDSLSLDGNSASSIQYIAPTHKAKANTTTGSTSGTAIAIISSFTANGTEPFWAANFSGTTLARQSPDLGNIIISGLIGPVSSGSSWIWTDTGSATTVTITSGSCTNGMSEQIFSGSINLTITGQTWLGCASY